MTVKQKKLIPKLIANGGTVTGQDLLDAGYSKSIAHNPHKVIKSKTIQTELQKVLRKEKITLKRAIKPISEGLDAEKLIVMGSKDDSFIDRIPDHSTRLKASSMALDLLGVKNKPDNDPEPINTDDIKRAIKKGDIKELQRVIFKENKE